MFSRSLLPRISLIGYRFSSTATSTAASNNAVNNATPVLINEIEKGIFHVLLNRPDKMNALNVEMFESIARTATSLKAKKSARAIILSGSGKAFCTGLDVKSVGSNPMNFSMLLDKPAGTEYSNLAQDVAYLWRQLPIPVIASLHGMCFGGGLQIAMGADFRISTPDCQLSIMEGKWGLIPDMSASVTFREHVRMDVVKELTMTARIFTAEEGCGYGFVTRCSKDPFQSSLELAREIAARSPDAVAGAKKLFQSTWVSPESAGLDQETKIQKRLLASWNQMSAAGRSMGVKVPYKSSKDFEK